MSLSTTTTATYELVKYSRAYNQSSATQNQVSSELDWQHFSNPVIRLTMDTRKAPGGTLEAYRLRITWALNPGLDAMDVDQREVLFEDLDLVAYSSVSNFQAPNNMPIKAVYQGPVVGLRYQYPRVTSPGQTPGFRRFQVTFQTAEAANAFVESIRFICPCKPNNAPPPRTTPSQFALQARRGMTGQFLSENRAHTATPTAVSAHSLGQASSTAANETPTTSYVHRTNTTVSSAPRPSGTSSSLEEWNDLAQTCKIVPSVLENTTLSGPGVPSSNYDPNSSRPSSTMAIHSPDGSTSASDPTFRQVTARHSDNTSSDRSSGASKDLPNTQRPHRPLKRRAGGSSSDIDDTFPSSGLPPSSPPPVWPSRIRSPVLMPPPPIPPQTSQPCNAEVTPTPPSQSATLAGSLPSASLPSSGPQASGTASSSTVAVSNGALRAGVMVNLQDSAGLYDLSKDQLELLVAQVVREEGFAELMANLNGMWRIKGLVGMSRP